MKNVKMIDPKELRIGNLVHYGTNSVEIRSLHINSPALTDDGHLYIALNDNLRHYAVSYSEVEPIPLTEEWLANLVFFESLFAGYFTNSKGIGLLKSDGSFWLLIYKNHSIIKVGTIHQLQNLYFALTGEELIIATADPQQ